MSIYAGPEITDSGLLLNLDVANPQSFGWTNPATALSTVEVLVVAGGGGSGGGGNSGYQGGGGGGGGVVYHPAFAISEPVTVTVGTGGGGGTQVGDTGFRGGSGGNSSFGTLIAIGGGGGGGGPNELVGGNGGSGGGGALYSGTGGSSTQPSYSGATVYGNSGGTSQGVFTGGGAGGAGGGAGGAGGSANTVGTGGAGGFGVAFSINGTATFYGGGGAGQGGTANGAALNGATPANTAGTAGTGAGGGGRQSTSGLAGGSGIVIVRYPGTQRALGGTVTTVAGSTVHTFTSSGTFIPLTWSDVSGRGNNGTLFNNPTYSSADSGSIVLDGVDDYVSTGLVLPSPSTTPTTFDIVFRNNDPTSSFEGLMGASQDLDSGFSIGFFGGQSTIGFTYNTAGQRFEQSWTYNSAVISQGTFVFSGRTITAYRNGQLISTFTAGFDARANSNGIQIGRNLQGGWNVSQVNVYSVKVYNRALTADEVNQNYQATRGRYGI